MRKTRFFLFFLLLAGQLTAIGQDFSNKGKEFWIAYPAHIDGTTSVMGLYITSSVNTTGTLELAGGAPLTFTVSANAVTRIFLNATGSGVATGIGAVYFASNKNVYLNKADGIAISSAIKISSQDPIVVYSHIIKSARSGATLVLPTTVLGSEYIAPSISSVSSSGLSSDGTAGGIGEIAVVATLPNTVIGITPTVAGSGGRPSGTYFEVTLANAGDCYQFQSISLGDLSGTKIISKAGTGSSGCKPVAVFTATTWSNFDCGSTGNSGDNLYQQLFPTRSWGKVFVTAPFINRPGDIFRIFVQNSSTTVQIQENGVTRQMSPSTEYNSNGKFYFYKTLNPIVITGSDPISVAQYITSEGCKTGCGSGSTDTKCYSDPEMVLLNPVEQTLQDITFFSAHANYVPAGQTNVAVHFVNIIVSKNYKNSLTIDNAPPKGVFVDIPGSNYSYLQEDLTVSSATNPIHRVKADTSFSAIVYGYGNVESYGYNGGTNVKDFTPSATFQNPYNRIDSAVTCINTPLKFSVPLTFTPATIQWDFSAAPNITPNTNIGPLNNPAADSTRAANGLTINYYSTKVTYTFTKANTAALRDTIKIYTTSSTPDGCGSSSQSFSLPVKVNDQPVAKFSLSNSGCVSDTIQITDQSTVGGGTISRWLWNFGDNTTDDRSSGAVFGKLYSTAGSYTIKLRSISDIGCISDEVSQAIKLTNKPTAKFTLPTVACAGTDIVFSDASATSSGTLVKWIWNLDDGAGEFINTTNASVKANYAGYGPKNPTLKVEMDNGCRSDAFAPNPPLKINAMPDVGYILPQICLSDANGQFTDTTKIAEGSSVFSYLWNFNAGTPAITPGPTITSSTQKNPLVTYRKADNYTVSLTVTSALGCVATKATSFTVNGSTPKASFDLVNLPPYCGIKPILLKNTSTVDFGNLTKLDIYPDFSKSPSLVQVDASPTPGKVYPQTYTDFQLPSSQTYTIKLIAYSGGSACADSTTKTITVFPQPKAAFSTSAPQLCFGDTTLFLDKSNGVSSAAVTWVWDLGIGDKSAVQNPVKQYNDSGLINVSLYFYNADGCISDTASKQLTVYPKPKVVLTHNVTTLSGGTITIVPEYIYGHDLQYLWIPATYLSSDTAQTPVSVPQDDITYKLLLTGTGGCSASDTIFVKVLKGPEVPNVFSPNGDGINDVWKIRYLEDYPGATVQVFNRFGQLVFYEVGYDKPWDGTYKGSALPIGTYYYIINPKNGRPTVSGSVTIIK